MAKQQTKNETFQLVEPNAETVLLVGDFTEWVANPIPLTRQKNGIWKATVPLQPGEHEYRFVVDGEWRNDARSPATKPNPFGGENSVRQVGM
jgi:1,4-alpha-glucan branching enzyme